MPVFEELKLDPAEAYGTANLEEIVRDRFPAWRNRSFKVLRRSLDARGSRVQALIRLVEADSPLALAQEGRPFQPKVLGPHAPELHVVGAGPAGIFAALRCLEHGWRPVVFERGQAVRERRRDVALLSREGQLNPESNYCYGEGGAGTFSDGKLYTRSSKRGDVYSVLRLLIELGAPASIAYEAHPHIGTNKLPALVQKAREIILEAGGRFYFNQKVVDLRLQGGRIRSLLTQNGTEHGLKALVLCTGHSSREVYRMLDRLGIAMEPKALAMGIRVEHPQEWVNRWRYRLPGELPEGWPVASYAVVEQVQERGVYSFCMCPGGIMAPCATETESVVTNGWSPSRRNNGTANAGWVTEIGMDDVPVFTPNPALSLLHFQEVIEARAAEMGGRPSFAPAQDLQAYATGKPASGLPACSYRPGTTAAPLHQLYPSGIQARLAAGLMKWQGRWPELFGEGAVAAGPESRTSAPVRIPRDPQFLHHPQCTNLYPVGEGAGYAGGIMSAILDARRTVDTLVAGHTPT